MFLAFWMFSDEVKISQDKSGWFYHQVHFADMDGDGLLDAVTARCQWLGLFRF